MLFIILQGLFSRRCITYDKEKQREAAEIAKKNKIYKKLFEELPSLLRDQAVELNKIAKNIQEKGIIPGDRWTFDDASNYICESIMFFLKQFCKTNDIVNVYYIKRNDDGKKVKMVGCANDLGEAPSIFGKERSITSSKTAYYDIKMFERNKLKAIYKLSAQEVDKVFYYEDRERQSDKIEQFLFIPVTCDKEKTIGLIEIIVPKGSRIADNEQEMQEIQKLLKIYAAIFVLLHKAEKAAIAIPNITDADAQEF